MSKYENKVMEIFKAEKLSFYREKTFKDLKRGLFRFDFYIYNYKGRAVIVEVDGEQHFKPIYGRQAFLKGKNMTVRKIPIALPITFHYIEFHIGKYTI